MGGCGAGCFLRTPPDAAEEPTEAVFVGSVLCLRRVSGGGEVGDARLSPAPAKVGNGGGGEMGGPGGELSCGGDVIWGGV